MGPYGNMAPIWDNMGIWLLFRTIWEYCSNIGPYRNMTPISDHLEIWLLYGTIWECGSYIRPYAPMWAPCGHAGTAPLDENALLGLCACAETCHWFLCQLPEPSLLTDELFVVYVLLHYLG